MLKDGQIHEQGNFKELIALDGIFASMWADQVSSNDDAAHSIAASSVKKEMSGYIVDADVAAAAEEVAQRTEDTEQASISAEAVNTTSDLVDISDMPVSPTPVPATSNLAFPVSFPTSEDVDDGHVEEPVPEAVVQSPPAASAPVAFPTSGDTESEIQREETSTPVSVPSPTPTPAAPGVTFGASVNSPPSRTETPDPDGEGKRKRIGSQNFQRLARRISLTTRRQSSGTSILPNLPGFRRDQSSPKVSVDEGSRAESSAAGTASASPAGSVTGEEAQGKLKKKDKKRKGSTF